MTRFGVLRFGIGALLAAALLIALSRYESPALAEPDISGDWTSQATGDVSGMCANTFALTGNSLRAEIDCDIVGRGTLEGTIDLASGSFVIEGSPGGILLHVEGKLSPDGQSIEGTWAAPGFGFSGTFTGTRGKLVRPTPAPPVVPSRPPEPGPLSEAVALRHGPASFGPADAAFALNTSGGYALEADLAGTDRADPESGNRRSATALAGLGVLTFVVIGLTFRDLRAPRTKAE